MALETLKGYEKIDGFGVTLVNGEIPHVANTPKDAGGIYYSPEMNYIGFQIQNGPIKESGVNGCQVDTLIKTAAIILEGLNVQFPCKENKEAIDLLNGAYYCMKARKTLREKRSVEGKSKI